MPFSEPLRKPPPLCFNLWMKLLAADKATQMLVDEIFDGHVEKLEFMAASSLQINFARFPAVKGIFCHQMRPHLDPGVACVCSLLD